MTFTTRFIPALAGLLAFLAAPPVVPTATAGCGCDHPPPAFAPIMPSFASPGTEITLNANGFLFEVGSTYGVNFGEGTTVPVIAEDADEILLPMPDYLTSGPAAIRVTGPNVDHTFSDADFTVLPEALPMPTTDGVSVLVGYEAAISADGTVLIPFDVTDVADPMQFAFVLGSMRLTFATEDVVFWNRDGVDLTLFTLDVEDPTQQQWGSYYGWKVNQDGGIKGKVYNRRKKRSMGLLAFSDLLTYWRHEFYTYKMAHEPGGTHEVGDQGYHIGDGTLHIDHDNLVLAISGQERVNFWDPNYVEPLAPGSRIVELFVGTMVTENPVEPDQIHKLIRQAVLSGSVSLISAPGGNDPMGLQALLSVYAAVVDDE